MNPKVYLPNIHLFAFSEDTAKAYSEIKFSRWLWEECNKIISKKGHSNNFKLTSFFINYNDATIPYIPLIDDDFADNKYYYTEDNRIHFKSTKKNPEINNKDFIYAVKSYDRSYGLGLNFHLYPQEHNKKNQIINIKDLNLNPDNCFILQDDNSFVGQTLLLTIKLKSNDRQKDQKALKSIADQCLKDFFPPNYNTPFNRAGKLFGSPIFEYGIFRQLETYSHILVWLFYDDEVENKFEFCYNELLDLFSFHAKIINAYKKSHKNAQIAKDQYKKIEDEINKVLKVSLKPGLEELELKQFNEQLIQLPGLSLEYANQLRDIEDCSNLIAINTRNYTEKLQEIKSLFPHDSIRFLEIFAERSCKYFHEQVTTDVSYLHHGFSLINQAIASIRGQVEIDRTERENQVEIDRAERERELQVRIFAIGGGIGAGGISASSFHVEKPDAFLKELPLREQSPFLSSLVTSLIFGLIIGSTVWGVMIPKKRAIAGKLITSINSWISKIKSKNRVRY